MRNPRPMPTRRRVLASLSLGAGIAVVRSADSADTDTTREVNRNMESIHQEVSFNASRERVYAALTDAGEFHKVTLLSGAVRSGMVKATQATQISREPGGAFTLFGGHIVGRQIELVPQQRIVQAWRPVDWEPGVFSVVRFELHEQGHGTRLVFDHTGFPQGQGEHLAQGWKLNYWDALEKYLA